MITVFTKSSKLVLKARWLSEMRVKNGGGWLVEGDFYRDKEVYIKFCPIPPGKDSKTIFVKVIPGTYSVDVVNEDTVRVTLVKVLPKIRFVKTIFIPSDSYLFGDYEIVKGKSREKILMKLPHAMKVIYEPDRYVFEYPIADYFISALSKAKG